MNQEIITKLKDLIHKIEKNGYQWDNSMTLDELRKIVLVEKERTLNLTGQEENEE